MKLRATYKIHWFIALLLSLSGSAWGLEPGVLTGKVTDSAGKPLPNVTVYADNTLLYNTNAAGITDAQGNYRIDVSRPAGTWHATAQIKRQFQGKTYTFDLHPNDDNLFAGNQGAVRNFTWRLRGQRPDGGHYGSKVIAYGSLDNPFYIESSKIELTLEPVGTLADGSSGAPIVSRLQSTPDGDAVVDVPLARYKVSARYIDPEQGGQIPLWVRLRNEGDYQPSLTTDFKTVMSSIHQIEVEVRTP